MEKKTKNALVIGAICFFAYSVCYIVKNIIGALQPQMEASGAFGFEQLGLMSSVFLFAYGGGQLVNGILGNHIPARYMVFTGILLPGIVLIAFPAVSSDLLLTVLWGACGFFCSMLWGPMTALIGENTDEKWGRRLLSLLTAASLAGILITYLLALFSATGSSWQQSFRVAGIITVASAGLWFVGCLWMEKTGRIRPSVKKRVEPENETTGDGAAENAPAPHTLRGKLAVLFSFGFFMMLLAMMCSGVIRNAVSIWVPTILVRYFGFTEAFTATVSMLIPFVNFAGTFVSLWALRFFKNEKHLCAALYLIAAAGFAVLILFHDSAFVCVASLFIACAMVTGVNSIIFSVYVLRYKERGAISGLSGFFDFGAYLSAALANLYLTRLSEIESWNGMMVACLVVSTVGMLTSVLAVFSRKDVV